MMRRALVTALAVPALFLGACDTGGDSTEPTPTTEADSPTETTPVEDGTETGTADDAETTDDAAADSTQDSAAETEVDDAATTDTAASTADVPGGEEGQAAADVARAFFMATIEADEAACDYLISFSDVDRPMKDVDSDMELCQEVLPAAMEAQAEAQELGAEERAVLEAMRINGAQVEGDTAIVDRTNLSELFREALGDEVITLRKIEGDWYVDLDKSFQPAE
ncbi:hypothetical protein ACQBAT_02465 [Ornithinimicrobium sp. Y1847]|uniref:hypothetical protein n=1 Tax=Ornithinimicrobium sp. Y1847 TaxID=3405419 RepID=UPI003B673572